MEQGRVPQNGTVLDEVRDDHTPLPPPPGRANHDISRRYCCCCPRILLTITLILVAIIAVVAITIAVLFFIFNPSGPTFSITHVVLNTPKNHSPPQYEISLRAKNSNERLGIVYENSEVVLLFEDNKVATGKFPALEQDRDASTPVKVELMGRNGLLPKQNKVVRLNLDMRLTVRIIAGGLKLWTMKANVVCEFEVSNLGDNTRILSQQCDTKFKY
ncbi:hypothetical protein SESBI_30974 [Sesbania bispinosa]|nr:hypothetical protein SESBI_30974 [Sesbania bispinosa]